MIFSRIFAPSYQSPKPEKRVQAIENLSPDKAQEKTILHELAFNDEDPRVSLSALEKLNSFVLWLKMSQIAKSSRVKKVAEKKVNEALLGEGNVTLGKNEKAAFLTETASPDLVTQLVPQLLESDPALLGDEVLATALIEKVNKPAFTQFVFLETTNENLRQRLIIEQSDIAVLQKWMRKVTDGELENAISRQIDSLNVVKQKPVELKKNLTLALSKYQALLDKNDVELILEKQAELESELQDLFSQSGILLDDDKKQFDEKYQRIAQQVTRYLNRVRPAWENKQRLSALTNTKALCEQQLNYAQEQVEWLYSQRLCEATLADVATVNESVRGVEATLEQLARMDTSLGDEKRVSEISHEVNVLNAKLESFSMQQQYGQKLLIKLQHLEGLANAVSENEKDVTEQTADARTAFNQAKQDYFSLARELTSIPRDIAKRFTQVSKQVNAFNKAQDKKSSERIKQVRKQISVIENLIDQGKFRVAMGKFRKLQESYAKLSADIQEQVHKRFENVSHHVARLEGWQDYLAAPRKPALVEEAETLAKSPVESIKARSEAIKYLRQQWLSLTPTTLSSNDEAKQSDTLQEQFDAALEKAFEPCRQHYAKLDAQRMAALDERKALIHEAKTLDTTLPVAELAKHFDRLAKQWFRAGQVERSVFEQLKQEWKQASLEVQTKVNQWQSENQLQKKELVAQAKALVEVDDIQAAADEAQQLQAKWKSIGHAGNRDESRLWAEFKSANDSVFSRLKAERKEQSNALQDRVAQLLSKVENLDVSMDDTQFASALSEIKSALFELPKSQQARVERKIHQRESERQSRVEDAQWETTQHRAQALIDLLTNSEQELNDERQALMDKLGKRWSALIEKPSGQVSPQHDRHWLTVALEVATQMPSPESDASIRSSVQLQMMTAKLEQGESQSAADILAQWLEFDHLKSADHQLANRVATILESRPEVVA